MAGTRRTHPKVVFLTVAMAVVLALAGCGGGDDLPSAADDTARAERIVFTDADLPDLVRDDDDDEDDAEEDDPFRECLGDNPLIADLGEGPRGAEATFSDAEDGARVRASAVTLAERGADAEEAFAQLTEPGFVGCFEDAIRAGFTEELTDDAGIRNLSVTPLLDDFGDESVGYRVALDVVSGTESASFAFDYVFLRVDRGIAALFSFDIDDTLDADERSRLAGVLADRLEDEL